MCTPQIQTPRFIHIPLSDRFIIPIHMYGRAQPRDHLQSRRDLTVFMSNGKVKFHLCQHLNVWLHETGGPLPADRKGASNLRLTYY